MLMVNYAYITTSLFISPVTKYISEISAMLSHAPDIMTLCEYKEPKPQETREA